MRRSSGSQRGPSCGSRRSRRSTAQGSRHGGPKTRKAPHRGSSRKAVSNAKLRISGRTSAASLQPGAVLPARGSSAAGDKTALLVVHDPGGRDVENWSYAALEQAVLRAAYTFRAKYELKPAAAFSSACAIAPPMRSRFSAPSRAASSRFPHRRISPSANSRSCWTTAKPPPSCSTTACPTAPSLPISSSSPKRRSWPPSKAGLSRDTRDTAANDPAFLIYTSGTTANPKGVLHAHRSAWGRRPMYQGWYGITPADRLMHAGSFNWTYTMGTGLTDPWANGATSHRLYGREGPGAVAAAPARFRCHHLRRGPRRLPSDPEIWRSQTARACRPCAMA